jgi:hypothetical protein
MEFRNLLIEVLTSNNTIIVFGFHCPRGAMFLRIPSRGCRYCGGVPFVLIVAVLAPSLRPV